MTSCPYVGPDDRAPFGVRARSESARAPIECMQNVRRGPVNHENVRRIYGADGDARVCITGHHRRTKSIAISAPTKGIGALVWMDSPR